jgi:myo-inositol 2-dehydrogenase / D-chiro-inositol 1-dehydrogenase
VVGQDARSPIRSVERDAKPPGATYRDFWDRFGPGYRSELAAFVETVRTGAPSPCSLEEARSALTIALAADLSRSKRRPVSIEEVELAQAPPNS